jgi:membrane-associated phospholipid phosphatase
MAAIYENLLFVIDVAGNTADNYDLLFMQIDEFLFSVQPTIWMQKLLHPITVEYFMIAYGMFFIYPFFYLIYLLQKNKIEYFQKVMFAEILMLIVSLSCFVLFPTWGPRFILDSSSSLFIQQSISYSENLQGVTIPLLYNLTGYKSFFNMQVDLWNYLERIKTDCFPSLHTGLCLLCLLYAIRFREVFKNKKLAMWFWIVGVISLIISTVYLRYHWVIDVIAGIILTIVVYYITEWIFSKWMKFREIQNLEFEKLLNN